MRRSPEFAAVLRSGSRSRRGALVVHARPALTAGVPHVGLVVGGSVGNSVTRHRVTRRLRAQVAARLSVLPEGAGVVVRALPEAATATSASLGVDLDRALAAALARIAGSSP
jgi:ribonuclease P protein component